ncbi:MAG TPA: hypothetical protein VFA03_15305 [Acetobacteraceae bacterium]|nr:hypothetical protein [Acetobacteraceae bacterium]
MESCPDDRVVPFPLPAARRREEPDRLARALERMDAAVAAERAAVAEWRGALGRLQASTGRLSRSFTDYSSALTGLAGHVERLNRQSRALAVTAARLEAASGTAPR